eukprot:TRINITY_DN336_c0_g1_i2.p1 TRINITY_DN336_c0_g1~~TRINITY_DN336_c0_g1_i2.p1  ORF type:complete len:415 (+),score=110.17 TRINITY_DN336_c0_g1_i2:36-1247(+)
MTLQDKLEIEDHLSEGTSDDEGDVFVDENDAEERIILDSADADPSDLLDEEMEGADLNQEEGQTEMIADDSVQGFFEHTEAVYSVSLHPNGEFALTGSGDDRSFLWNVTNGDKIFELTGHTDTVSSTGFNHDGKYIATGSFDSTVKIWETESGKLLQTLEGPSDSIEWIDWHPKGNVILAGSQDKTVWMWLAATGAFMNMFAGHSAASTCGGFSPDGKYVVSGSEDGTLRVFDPKTANTVHTFEGDLFHSGPIHDIALKDLLILTASEDTKSILLNISSGKILGTFQGHEESIETVDFNRGELPLCASGSIDGTVKVWDLNTFQCRHSLVHKNSVVKVKFHPNLPLVYTASVDKSLHMFDARTGKEEKVWTGHLDILLDFDISSDGNTIVTGSDDKTCLVFRV